MKKIVTWIIYLCLMICMLPGCNRGSGMQKEDIRVVFVPKLTGNAFFEAAHQGARAYAEKHGFIVDYQGSAQASIDDQIAIIKKAIKENVNAVCVSALDAAALDPVMKEAMAAGITAVTWDSDVSGDARMLMVSQGTPDQLGTMLVEMGAKSLANRGKIRPRTGYAMSGIIPRILWLIRIPGIKPARPTLNPPTPIGKMRHRKITTAGRIPGSPFRWGRKYLRNIPALILSSAMIPLHCRGKPRQHRSWDVALRT